VSNVTEKPIAKFASGNAKIEATLTNPGVLCGKGKDGGLVGGSVKVELEILEHKLEIVTSQRRQDKRHILDPAVEANALPARNGVREYGRCHSNETVEGDVRGRLCNDHDAPAYGVWFG